MIIVNEELNCQRMLKSKEYQIPKLKNKEDIWLIKYLIDNKIDKEKIFKIWKEFYKKKIIYNPSQEEVESWFQRYYNCALCKKKLFVGNKILFFRNEINQINKIRSPLWIKEFYVCLLGYIKFIGVTKINLFKIPTRQLLLMTSLNRVREENIKIVYDKGKEQNIIIINDNLDLSFNFNDSKDKKPLKILKTSIDIPQIFGYIKNTTKCKICGKIFEYSSKTKRDICEQCQKQKRSTKK